jgi:AraC-like DNA-binding protein
MLKNQSMHRNCYCYYDGVQNNIRLFNYSKAKTGTVHLVTHEILFVIKGWLRVTVKNNYDMDRTLTADEFSFMPTGSILEFSTGEETVFLIFKQPDDMRMPVCHNEMFKSSLDNIIENNENIYALRANERIKHHIEGIMSTMADGLTCSLYMQYEIYKLLFLIHSYYTKEECSRLFAPLVNPDAKFSEFVRLNYDKYKTVAKIAEAMRMSPTQFAKQFKKVFLVTPKEWILCMRARRIHWELCQTTKPIKQIADEYDFLPENLIRFCKQRLGKTPAVIRGTIQQNEYDGYEPRRLNCNGTFLCGRDSK